MPTRVNTPPEFLRQLKRLARKYPNVTHVVYDLIGELEADNRPGDLIPNVGYDVYKVRLKNPDSQRGKSGGFRVVYYLKLIDNVILILIYSKTEINDISPNEIRDIIDELIRTDKPDGEI
ncbi:MAG: type II toxin-antitoxin system RelE/ParE family toxin [Anaerolineae bacterium]|jgi:mRNA-degrading endonuclease RelE of RelBE toxin-antitoxin system|nr:type II toxin-antitoxin system RelE/ParE family toxin [Anaerolineae bacterium]